MNNTDNLSTPVPLKAPRPLIDTELRVALAAADALIPTGAPADPTWAQRHHDLAKEL
ncbi:hypothetical protein [Mycolicibacterium sp.]|uniref:hypothetical protein n=1 Tax=Mycolicibacterium sp. TaxID=2320850 RepID=UPI003D0E8318